MAEFICSVWRITHSGVVLLDYGDRLTGEPDFGFDKAIEVAPLLRASHVKVFDRGNVQHDFSWDRIVRHASVESARSWRLSHMVAVSGLGVGDMEISIKDGESYTLKNAAMPSMRSESGNGVSASSFESRADYSVVGGQIETV